MSNLDDIQLKSSIREIKSKIEAIENHIKEIPVTQSTDISDIKSRLLAIDTKMKNLGNLDFKIPDTKSELDDIKANINEIQHILIDTVCPVIQEPNWFDISPLFSDISNSIKETNKKVCELNSDFSVLGNINIGISNVLLKLTEISNKLINEQAPNQILINYPRNGVANILTGYTSFDFYSGIVTNTDGTTNTMSDSIENYQETYIKSFIIYADRKVDLEITGKSSCVISIPAGTFRLPYGEVSKVKVYAAADTNVWISGSFVPNGAPQMSPSSVDSTTQPNDIIAGSKTDISTTAAQLTTTSTLINKVVTVKVRALGGTYIAIGNSTTQPYRLTAVGATHDIDYIDSLDKVYCVSDTISGNSVEFIGG